MKTIHTGEEGITITATLVNQAGVAYDMSGGVDTKQINLRDPSGNVSENDADFGDDGSDGVLEYVTDADDIDEVGIWQFQAFVDDGNGLVIYSTIGKFKVVAPLA